MHFTLAISLPVTKILTENYSSVVTNQALGNINYQQPTFAGTPRKCRYYHLFIGKLKYLEIRVKTII